MASTKQVQAARRNVKRAQRAATRKRTIAKLPARTRRGLQEQARLGRERGGQAGHALESRNRQQLFTHLIGDLADEDDMGAGVALHDRSGGPRQNRRSLERIDPPQQTDEQCPECSSPMVIKSGRFGRFLACSRYPECKGRKPFTVTTGVRCPRDAGELLERRSRRGRIFYGCSNYPKCDFTTWTRPLPQPCPNCGGLVTAERDNKAKCTVCNWRGGVVQQAPEPTPIA